MSDEMEPDDLAAAINAICGVDPRLASALDTIGRIRREITSASISGTRARPGIGTLRIWASWLYHSEQLIAEAIGDNPSRL